MLRRCWLADKWIGKHCAPPRARKIRGFRVYPPQIIGPLKFREKARVRRINSTAIRVRRGQGGERGKGSNLCLAACRTQHGYLLYLRFCSRMIQVEPRRTPVGVYTLVECGSDLMRHYLSLSFSESDLPQFLLRLSASGNPQSSPARPVRSPRDKLFLSQISLSDTSRGLTFGDNFPGCLPLFSSWWSHRPVVERKRFRRQRTNSRAFAARKGFRERLIPSLLIIVMGRRGRYKRSGWAWKKGEEMRIVREVLSECGGPNGKERRRASLSKDAGQHRGRAPSIKSANGNK